MNTHSASIHGEDEEEFTELAPPRPSQWKRVMRSRAITIALQILGAFAAVGAGTARPLMTIPFGHLVNLYNDEHRDTRTNELKHEINDKVLLLLFAFIGQWTLVCIYGILFSVAAMRYTMRLRALYLKAVVSQHIEQVSQADTATDLSTNAAVLEDALAEKMGTMFQAASTLTTSIIISFYWSWRLTLVVVFVILVTIAKDILTTLIDARLERRVQIIEAKAAALAEECISGIRTITACCAIPKVTRRYGHMLDDAKRANFLKSPVLASQYAVTYFAVLSAYALGFWYGSRLLSDGKIANGGAICIVILSLNTGANALRLLLPLYGLIAKAKAAHSSMQDTIDRLPELDPFSKSGLPLSALYSRIEFDNVEFEYPGRLGVKVLRNLDLTFGAGKVTAVVGPSGCGKSSIVALLERFYSVSSGVIRINGTNISSYNLKSLRSNVRVVQQESVLFNDTILNNIAHGLIGSPYHALSDREKKRLIVKVCKDMQAHDFISQLPQGYETIVGNRGSLLSGGQRQRIAIARAVVSNPVILIFDEATSALDTHSERLVQTAIDRVSRGRTTVIIAHNLTTVKHADRIIMMRDGRVTEEGTHSSLLRTSDDYVRSWKAQNLAAEERHRDAERISSSSTRSKSYSADIYEDKIDLEAYTDPYTAHSENEATTARQPRSMSFLQTTRYILSGSKTVRLVCAGSLLMCITTGAIYPAQSVLFGYELVSFQKSTPDMVQSVKFWSLIFFLLAVISFFSFFALESLSSICGAITSRFYKGIYLRGMIGQQMSFFDDTSNTPGLLMSHLSSHPGHLQGFIIILSSLAVTTFNLASVSILGLALSWRFALVAIFGVMPVISVAGFLRIQSQSRKSKCLSEPLLDSAQYAVEVIANIRTVSSFAMEAEVCSIMAKKMNKSLRSFYRNVFVTMPLFAFSHSGNLLGMTFSFWYAGTLLTNHEISAFHLWIIFFGIVTGSEATSEFFAHANSIVHARSSSSQIEYICSTSAESCSQSSTSDNEKPPAASISLENVFFAYPGNPESTVLHNISLQIQQSQNIAIVGPSGSGKSTIISLLERFYDPSIGNILIGGVPLRDMDIDTYRDRVSLVSQDTQLFEGTIRDNLMLGVPVERESREAMIDAARAANIHDFIMGLPEGYETACGSKGAMFSGGQRQRLAIARALVRNPIILLLDEATNSLDSESEREVKKALHDARKGRTTVAVAHRLSTIRDADCIYVLVGGRIAESGTHDELTRARGIYWGMCQSRDYD